MFLRDKFMIVVGLFACAGLTLWATPTWADLDSYIRKPEPKFSWKQNGKSSQKAGDQMLRPQNFFVHWRQVSPDTTGLGLFSIILSCQESV